MMRSARTERTSISRSPLPTGLRLVACGSSMGSRLEQLNRVAVRIFNLNLFAARANFHFISETQTRLFEVSNLRTQILHLKQHTVPPAGLLLTAVGHWSGSRCSGTAQD